MPKFPITHIVEIYQFQRTGSTEGYSDNPIYENINACISPTGTDIQPSGDVPAFQVFEIFLYDITLVLHNGDKLITQDNSEYRVNGVPYLINNQFLQYIRVLGQQVV